MANQRSRRATLKDVAQRAGTSVATASRVLSGTGFVSVEARARIVAAATALNYQPNQQAVALRTQTSHEIGLLVPNLLNAYYTALADALSNLLAARGYHLLLAPTRDDAGTESQMLRDLAGHVDGLILVPAAVDDAMLTYLHERAVPAVAIVRRVPGDALDTVTFEDFAGARAATQHLLDLGHRQIGYIGGDVHYSSNHARWQGYLAALRGAGLAADDAGVKLGALRSTWGALAALDLLRSPAPPTAIFAASNAVVSGLLRTLRAHRIAVPASLSLISFDDVEWFAYTDPSITAISHSHTRLAEAAVTLLLSRLAEGNDRPPALMEIGFELVLRSSTATPRSGPLVLRSAWPEGLDQAA